jgi:flagellar motor switch protein FliN/FliY
VNFLPFRLITMNDATHTAHVIALNELHDIPQGARPAIVDPVNPLHHIKTRLQVCVGDIELTVGELMSAKEHQVFVLDRLVDQPVDVLLEGKVVARGQLVAVDDQFAVRITDIPTPLKA